MTKWSWPKWSWVVGIVGAVLCLWAASLAHADYIQYQWVDDEGIEHSVNTEGEVPKHYRGRARRVSMPSPPIVIKHAGGKLKTDGSGRDIYYWQGRMRMWRNGRAEAQQQLTELRAQIQVAQYAYLVAPTARNYTAIQALRGQVVRVEPKLSRARRMVEERLPTEAKRAGVPEHWLDPDAPTQDGDYIEPGTKIVLPGPTQLLPGQPPPTQNQAAPAAPK